MKNLLFLALFLCSCTRHLDRVEPSRGMEQPKQTKQVNYEVGRAILPGMLGFVGGAIDTDTQRGRFTQQTIFLGATVSIGAWGKRPLKFYLIDFACGMAGAAIGTTVRNQIRR